MRDERRWGMSSLEFSWLGRARKKTCHPRRAEISSLKERERERDEIGCLARRVDETTEDSAGYTGRNGAPLGHLVPARGLGQFRYSYRSPHPLPDCLLDNLHGLSLSLSLSR